MGKEIILYLRERIANALFILALKIATHELITLWCDILSGEDKNIAIQRFKNNIEA